MILVLGLLWCNVGFAEILFKDCVSNNKDGTFRKFKEGRKHEYYINLNEKKIYRVKVAGYYIERKAILNNPSIDNMNLDQLYQRMRDIKKRNRHLVNVKEEKKDEKK